MAPIGEISSTFFNASVLSYIDPSFGSLVFQVIAGTILAGALTIKLWWERLTSTIGGIFGRNNENE